MRKLARSLGTLTAGVAATLGMGLSAQAGHLNPYSNSGLYQTDFRVSDTLLWNTSGHAQVRYLNNSFTTGGNLLVPFDSENATEVNVSTGADVQTNSNASTVDKSIAQANGYTFYTPGGAGVSRFASSNWSSSPTTVLSVGSLDSVASDGSTQLYTNGGGTGGTVRKSVTRWSVDGSGGLTEDWTYNNPSIGRIRGMAHSSTFGGVYAIDGNNSDVYYIDALGSGTLVVDNTVTDGTAGDSGGFSGLQESVLQVSIDGQDFLIVASGATTTGGSTGLITVYELSNATTTGAFDVYRTSQLDNGLDGAGTYALGLASNGSSLFWGGQFDALYARNISVVPEPASAVLAVLGLAAMVRFRGRRNM